MKRAFTLIELLVIIAIMGTMVTVGVVSFTSGRASTSVFAAARDVMAVVRRARSTALVTQKPVVVTFSNAIGEDGAACATVEIESEKFFTARKSDKPVQTLDGDIVGENGAKEDPFKFESERQRQEERRAAGREKPAEADAEDAAGETLEEVLAPTKISEEVMSGLKIKVLEEDESLVIPENETRKSKISIFSTAGAVSRSYEAGKEQADKDGAAEGRTGGGAAAEAEGTEEPVKVVFNANGTVKPSHRIWIYPEESTPDKGLCIEVDRYGEPVCKDVEGL